MVVLFTVTVGLGIDITVVAVEAAVHPLALLTVTE
jgi:hypothetical protein